MWATQRFVEEYIKFLTNSYSLITYVSLSFQVIAVIGNIKKAGSPLKNDGKD